MAGTIAGAVGWASAFFHAYLAGFVFWSGVPLGSAAILMTHHLTGGRWGWAIRRPLEAATLTLPVVALLFVGVAIGIGWLYPWADEALVARSHVLRHRHVYLNTPFVVGRAAGYLVLWGLGGVVLAARSAEQTRLHARGDVLGAEQARPYVLACVGLAVYLLTVSFAMIDWVMALHETWYSTIFGFYTIVNQLTSALAVAILLATARASTRAAPGRANADAVRPDELQDLASLLLFLVIAHAYMVFAQWIITWSGDKPHEVAFYTLRFSGGWAWLAGGLGVAQFALPTLLLLQRPLKRSPAGLGAVAALVLVAWLGEDAWFVLPTARDATWPALTVLGVLLPAALGGLWLVAFAVAWGAHAAGRLGRA